MRTLLGLGLATLLAIGCGGGDEKIVDAAITIDAPLVTADAPPVTPDAPVTPAGCTCVALGVDYMSGVGTAARIDLPSLTVTKDVVPGGVQSDPVVRYLGGNLYIVNRFAGENVTVVDPATWTVTKQWSTGAGSNPQDIAIRANRAYVVTLGTPMVKVWDTGGTGSPVELAPIMLPTVAADTDGNPDAASIAIVGTKAYVTLEHLQSFAPAAPGSVAVIDTMSNTVSTSFDLANMNPVNFLRERPGVGDLLVAEAPDFSAATGCVESITVGGTPAAGGCLASSMALGGYPAGIAPSDDGHVYVAAQSSPTAAKLVGMTDQGMIDATIFSKAGEVPTDVAYCAATHQIIANDAATGGIRVYDAMTHAEVTTSALDIGLPAGFANDIVCY